MATGPTGISVENDRGKPRSFFRVGVIWLGLAGLGYGWFLWMQPRAPVCPPDLRGVAGVRLLYRYECGKCHTVPLPGMLGKMGPPLAGVGHRHDRAFLEESLREPGRRVAPGYINGMPSFAHLTSGEMKELVDYLSTL